MTKIQVPPAMLKAADLEQRAGVPTSITEDILEAALRWLSENPIVPTDEQIRAMVQEYGTHSGTQTRWSSLEWYLPEWQRRMFLAPEPEVPEAIKSLMTNFEPAWSPEAHDKAVLEAYRRGKESK